MKIAFVVQRYGLEVNGGAELEARQIAEAVSPYVQVEVLTTCATDYLTWNNVYAPGVEKLNGVLVRRFAVRQPRDIEAFGRFQNEMFASPRNVYAETRWMALQGPDAPELVDFVRARQDDYDLFLFFTYLYASTWQCLPLVAHKSILFPTAHDEPPIFLDLFQSLFRLPRGFIFNAPEEDAFVRKTFANEYIPGAVLGVGVEVPQPPPTPVLDEDFILYLGRIDINKGCGELFEHFAEYKRATSDNLKLVLIGAQAMAVPDRPDIIKIGFMKEERFAWLAKARALVLPSPFESLSLVTLESWALGVPVLVNGRCDVLAGQCQRSNGGLYYTDRDEFVESLRLLRSNEALRLSLGRNGRGYVTEKYDWNNVTRDYISFFRATLERVRATSRGDSGGAGQPA